MYQVKLEENCKILRIQEKQFNLQQRLEKTEALERLEDTQNKVKIVGM